MCQQLCRDRRLTESILTIPGDTFARLKRVEKSHVVRAELKVKHLCVLIDVLPSTLRNHDVSFLKRPADQDLRWRLAQLLLSGIAK